MAHAGLSKPFAHDRQDKKGRHWAGFATTEAFRRLHTFSIIYLSYIIFIYPLIRSYNIVLSK